MITRDTHVMFISLILFSTLKLVFGNRWVYNEALGHSYYVKNGLPGLNFTEAEEHCVSIGGHLASIHSKEENSFIKDLAKAYNIYDKISAHGLLFGLHRNEFDINLWQYTDGTEVDYTNWRFDEPSNLNNKEHCTIILAPQNGIEIKFYEEWNDFLCDFKFPIHVCRKVGKTNLDEKVMISSDNRKEEPSDYVREILAGFVVLLNVLLMIFLFRCWFLQKCSKNNYKSFRDFLPRYHRNSKNGNIELTENNSIYAEIPYETENNQNKYIQAKPIQSDSKRKTHFYTVESTDV